MEQTYRDILEAASERGDKTFFHTVRASSPDLVPTSYAQINDRSKAISHGLLARGLRAGDRIAIAAPNCAEWLELYFGAVRVGLVVVTLNVRYRATELVYMLNNSGAKLVVSAVRDTDFDFEQFYRNEASNFPSVEAVYFINASEPEHDFSRLSVPSDGLLPEPQPDDPAVILYTSGTTGRPKGATLTHRSLLAAAQAQVEHTGLTNRDVTVSAMPLNHVGGITCAIGTTLISGSEIALLPAFSPATIIPALAYYGGTGFGGVPTMWTLVLNDPAFERLDRTRLTRAIIGGSNADPALCARIVEALPNANLVNLYGLSECSGAAIMSAANDDLNTVSESIGVPIPGVEARIADADGGPGELEIRTASVAAGYWELPEQSAETFGNDGWLRTGDIATIDETGHVRLLGRAKEMYVQGGYNVYPVEVENLLAHHPDVMMVAGIGVPDPVLGEVGRYFVIPAADSEPSATDLMDYCRERLASYKVPRQIVFVDQLPMTPAGKIQKATLKQMSTED